MINSETKLNLFLQRLANVKVNYIPLLLNMPKEQNTPKVYKLSLKRMPLDIRNFILDELNDIKKTGIQFSMESTVYKLLQTHPKYKAK